MNTSQDLFVQNRQSDAEPDTGQDLMKKLPGLLRILGTGILLIAMYSFLVKGWQSGNDVIRYLMMLGHTGILAAIGLASGHWLRDGKSARLLLTLALVSVPANFAILGAFIFSQTGGIDISQYPNYVAWAVDSLTSALLTSGGAMLVLVPVTLLGFTVLARSLSKKLSLLFLVSNTALLLPLRDPQLVAVLVLALTFVSIYFSHRASRKTIAIKTHEGITALGLLLLPLAVLMGRSLWLYSVDSFLLTVLATTVFFMMRQASVYFEPASKWRNTLHGLSLLPAVALIPFLGGAMTDAAIISNSLILPLAALISAGMVYDISRRSSNHASRYRNIALALVVISTVSNLLIYTSLPSAMICVAIGLGIIVLGYQKQLRNIFTSGFILMLTGTAHQTYELVHHFDLGNWFSMATLGVVAIVLAATIESHGGKLKSNLQNWAATFKSWDR